MQPSKNTSVSQCLCLSKRGGGTKEPRQNKGTNEEPRCLLRVLPLPSPPCLCSAGDAFPRECHQCPWWSSKGMDMLPENCRRALENSQLWFLARPIVLERNFNTALGTASPWAPLEYNGHSWAVTSALSHGGTDCSKIQGDAATKSALLPFFTAQGAYIKFYSIVDYFLYMPFFPY